MQTLQVDAIEKMENENGFTKHTIDGIDVYYSKLANPSANKIYTISYYDDYDFLASETISLPVQTYYGDSISSNTKGLTTGT
jgi:hypothetical protein